MTERQLAEEAAREAGALVREACGRPMEISEKAVPTDLVTEMDRAAEALIIKRLSTVYPEYGFLAEESPSLAGAEEVRWIIDPIDGTKNYAHAYPAFGISIALERAKRIVLGVVYLPMLDELFVAEEGLGATLNGARISVSTVDSLGRGLLTSGYPYNVWEADNDNSQPWNRLLKRAGGLRRSGSTAVDLCYVACGRVDGYWEPGLAAWDVAGGAIIVKEAGGLVTDYLGESNYVYGQQLVASNARIHDEMLSLIREPQ